MDSAYCTLDNKLYDAAVFALLPPRVLQQRRRALICPECRMEAFFRSASPPARGPCFGARPHGDGCDEATTDKGAWGIGGTDFEEQIFNSAGRIVIDLPCTEDGSDEENVGGAAVRRHGVGRTFGLGEGATTNATRRRLRTILRRLLEDPEFQFLETPLTLPEGRGVTTVREFFVPFDRVRDRAFSRFGGLWGMLTDARIGENGELWLNTGERSSISFVVPAGSVQTFMDRWEIRSPEDLSGARALILGTAQDSRNGKLFCPVEDLRYIVLDLA